MADDEAIVVTAGRSPAEASQPDQALDGRWHTYESNPVPWWVSAIWLGFFAFGITYLLVNLTRG